MNLLPTMFHFLYSLIIAVLFTLIVQAQPFVREITPFPLRDSSSALAFPFSGGFNNIKTQFIDINNDGFKDIIYISGDGTSGRLDNNGTTGFNINSQKLPGALLKDWFFLTDLDSDSDIDLVTGGVESYVRIYRNTGNLFFPSFSLWTDTLKDFTGEPIIVETASNHSFCDIDNDGDKDFFAGSSLGSITFFENIGSPAQPSFRFVTSSWQNISIVGGGKSVNKNSILHGANAIEFTDLDGDGDFDLLWGDFFSPSMYYIQNQGTPVSPSMRVIATGFPQNSDSILTGGFNMPRTADIDNDGDQDLFASVLYDPATSQRLMFYKNLGTRFAPNLRFLTDDYLHTFDAGTQSAPTITDINGDTKPDIITGSSLTPNGTLHLLLNEGTTSAYAFRYADKNFGGISAELSVTPAIADLNGDGLPDICIGTYYGTIFYYKNIGTLNNPSFILVGTLNDSFGSMIDVGLFARPSFTDIDKDGDIDIIIGAYNGRIVLYKNIGTISSAVFARDESYFGTIDAGDFSAPCLAVMHNDSLPQLFIGYGEGFIQRYYNTGSRTSPVWVLGENRFQGIFTGREAIPTFYDFDMDGDNDLLVGCAAGGLYFYRNNAIVGLIEATFTGETDQLQWYIDYSDNLLITGNSEISLVSIYTSLGELVLMHSAAEKTVSIPLKSAKLSAGIYLFTCTINGKRVIRKFKYRG